MSPAQQQRVRDLFEAALDRESADAQRWLGDAAADDPAVRDEVLSLLDHHLHAGRFLESGVSDLTAQLLVADDALAPGATVGSYVIVSLIGAGGMGEVYRAQDSRLKRDVALKILPASVAGDPERMTRFQREAEVLASLNHPNVATIYGIEANALVMEMVEGENLRGPLPFDDALHLARQIVQALEYAHERGIIHRDLKPANVKVTSDGVAKLLDFGLAKAIEDPAAPGGLSKSPTLTLAAAGVILGTAAYMAPEQAHGAAADRRADIWSFGAVLYEMLTGKQAFSGESISDTLASVLKLEPDWAALPADTPIAIRTLLRRCLIKDRTYRLQAIGEARIVIDDVVSGSADQERAPAAAAGRTRRLAIAGWSAAAILAAVAVLVSGTQNVTPFAPRPVVRFTDALPLANVLGALALSPDGSQLAFVGGPSSQIHVRPMEQLEPRAIDGTDGAANLCFSPDGQWIGFITRDRGLKKVRVAGGPVQTLADALVLISPPFVSWPQTDEIFFVNNGAVMKIRAGGGNPETVAAPDAGINYYASPQLLPGGQQLLLSARIGTPSIGYEFRLIARNLQTGEQKTLLERAGLAQYLPTGTTTGHIVYYNPVAAAIMAIPFDLTRLEVKGSPAAVFEGIQGWGSYGLFTISDSGTLVYGSGAPLTGTTLVWVERDGTEHLTASGGRRYTSARLAPDGHRVAVSIVGVREDTEDIWIRDLARGTLNRVTNDGNAGNPVWTPDGHRVIYERRPNFGDPAVLWVPADGSARSTVLATSSRGRIVPESVSPDGTILIGSFPYERKMFVLPLPTRDAKPQPFLDSRFAGFNTAFSPDGAWVAYSSDESGEKEVYVTPFPRAGGKFPISANGGAFPRWSRSGRELFYRSGDKMMVVNVETSPQFRAGVPKVLFERPFGNSYDPDEEGKRFLMIKPPGVEASVTGRVHIVLNWFEELRRRMPVE
jgi:hypothetical protein